MFKPWMSPNDAEAVVWTEMKEEMLKDRHKVIEMVTGKPAHDQARELLIEAEMKTRAAHRIIDAAK
jgi:DNA-directed RNA polymerase specialized sigma24 family protein